MDGTVICFSLREISLNNQKRLSRTVYTYFAYNAATIIMFAIYLHHLLWLRVRFPSAAQKHFSEFAIKFEYGKQFTGYSLVDLHLPSHPFAKLHCM